MRSPALRKFLAKVSTGQTYLSTNIYYWWHTKPITALQRYWLEKFFIMNMVYFDLLRVDVQDLVVWGAVSIIIGTVPHPVLSLGYL